MYFCKMFRQPTVLFTLSEQHSPYLVDYLPMGIFLQTPKPNREHDLLIGKSTAEVEGFVIFSQSHRRLIWLTSPVGSS